MPETVCNERFAKSCHAGMTDMCFGDLDLEAMWDTWTVEPAESDASGELAAA